MYVAFVAEIDRTRTVPMPVGLCVVASQQIQTWKRCESLTYVQQISHTELTTHLLLVLRARMRGAAPPRMPLWPAWGQLWGLRSSGMLLHPRRPKIWYTLLRKPGITGGKFYCTCLLLVRNLMKEFSASWILELGRLFNVALVSIWNGKACTALVDLMCVLWRRLATASTLFLERKEGDVRPSAVNSWHATLRPVFFFSKHLYCWEFKAFTTVHWSWSKSIELSSQWVPSLYQNQ
jgi:hypothetical protein